MQKTLEIACFNFQSAIIANTGGANRIELCENYSEGGITPSTCLLSEVINSVNIPVFSMIRPRTGNFIYSETEVNLMKEQIEFSKSAGCAGVVFGVLTQDFKINKWICKQLVELAQPMECTFHRAFDEVTNIHEALEDAIECGFKRILTSGRAKTAIDGKDVLKELICFSNNRISIMPGGSIRAANIKTLVEFTGANEFHSAAITNTSTSADSSEIENLIQALKN